MKTHITCFSGKIKIKGLSVLSIQQVQHKDYLIRCHLTKQIIEHAPNIFVPKTLNFVDNSVILSDFVTEKNSKQFMQLENRQYAIYIETENKNLNLHCLFFKNYECVFNKVLSILKLTLKPSPSLSFLFHLVDRPKFAKTNKLENLLSGQDHQSTGIITMDQSGRFLIQSLCCEFPAVGIWVRSNTIDDIEVYMRICNFLSKKVGKMFKKLALGWEKKNCIAFVRVSDNQVPQLYLVSWKQNNHPGQYEEQINEYELRENKEIVVEFKKQNLEFTLRGNHLNNQKKNQYVSPIKDQAKHQLQNQLQKIHLQQSPQFSSIKKHHWLQQRMFLLEKIQNQEQQITKLKRQIEILTKQIKKKRHSNSPSQYPLALFRSPSIFGYGSPIFNSESSHQKLKRLSSNDLQLSSQRGNLNLNAKIFESGSTRERVSQNNSQNSGSGGLQCQQNINMQQKVEKISSVYPIANKNRNKNNKQHEKIFESELDPWDMMYIIQ